MVSLLVSKELEHLIECSRVQTIASLAQFICASPSLVCGHKVSCVKLLKGWPEYSISIMLNKVSNDWKVRMGIEKVFENLTCSSRHILSSLLLEYLSGEAMYINGTLCDLILRQDVLLVSPHFLAILVPQNSYLNRLVVLEARGFCVKHVEVLSIALFDGPLTSFGVIILLLLHKIWHQTESKALLLACPHIRLSNELCCLRFVRDPFVLWPLTLPFEPLGFFSYRLDGYFFDLLVLLHLDLRSHLLFEAELL